MNKIAHVAIVAAASILLLAGCSSVSAEAVPEPSVSSTPSAQPSSTPSAAPITIQPSASPSPSSSQWNGFASQREWYLRSLAGTLSVQPTEDQLIAAGNLACEQLTKGTKREDVRVVTGTGDLADRDNLHIVTTAVQVYCPQFN